MIDRLNAALEGRYRIERQLGEGGMATVFLAEDVRHRRNVALKVLRPELAAVVGAERFLAEIEVTANLQHPHILPLFDSGEADSFLFYVMPYVEGESLRDKLDRERQLPVDEALRIAKAVASGLDYAHRQGVVHRDIKPANILLHDGEPVIADFGIALAVQQAGGGRLTETGLSLGTPYYMSPEQATADRDPGPRSDVYSLGCVLYETLTGEPPFPGSSAQQVLGRILTAEPARPTELRKTIPPHVEEVILRALQKLPADRFGSAAELARTLDEPATAQRRMRASGIPAGGSGPLRGWRKWLPWGVAGAAILALLVTWTLDSGSSPAQPASSQSLRAVLALPPGAMLTAVRLAISDDGSLMAVQAVQEGQPTLFVRRMDELEFVRLEGTEGADNQFLSPDGRSVAFRAGGAMRRVPLAGGPPVVMDPEGAWAGGDWTDDGTVFYTRSYRSGIWRVPAEGGQPQRVTEPRGQELGHWWPQLLPDGEHLLFTAFRTPIEEAGISVLSLETGERREVLTGGVHARYVPTGHLVFARGEALYTAPFDPDRLEVTGAAVPVVDDVAMDHASGLAAYALSETGTLVYLPASDFNAPVELVWADRDGQEEPVAPAADRYANPTLASDGRSLALALASRGQAPDVWILDLVRGTRSRITSGGGADFAPLVTPSGDRVIYVSESPVFDLYTRPSDASTPASPLVEGEFDKYPTSFTPDGDTLIYQSNRQPWAQVWKVPLSGGDPEPVHTPDFSVEAPVLSPDGRWLAYHSDESGRHQVYLSPYPDATRLRRQVSADGGLSPRWAREGSELIFRQGDQLLAVTVDPEDGRLGPPRVLFKGPYYSYDALYRNYDVTPDGERFLMLKRAASQAPRRVVVVTNFFDELREP